MISDKFYRALAPLPAIQNQFRRVVKRFPHRLRTIEHFGQRLVVDPSELHGFYLYYEREYDNYIFQFLRERASQYERALDLGANIGIYTAFLAAHIGRVDAFEPDPEVLARLNSNLEINHCRNVQVHATCVGKQTGTVHFLPGNPANQGLGRIVEGSHDKTGIVPSLSLDEFFGGPVSIPTLLKMDVEGAEWLILQGCGESIGKRTAHVDMLIEIHPNDIGALGGDVNGLRQMLIALGFSIHAVTPEGLSSIEHDDPSRFWWASDERHAPAQIQ
jgi:FkbM family methyltransferase